MTFLCIDFNNAYIVGIISGLISGFIVSIVCYFISEEKNRKIKYEEDIQNYCTFISKVIMQIDNICMPKKYKLLVKEISDMPVRKSFGKVRNKEFKKILKQIQKELNILMKNKCGKEKLIKIKNKLNDFELKILENKNIYYKKL